ncbi:MAG: hypothetical protein R6V75_07730 [Bacteroidales bacterium]
MMRTLSLIYAALFLLAFASGPAFGQASNKNKQVLIETEYHMGHIACAGEVVGGDQTVTISIWSKKAQTRVHALFVGFDTGRVYEGYFIQNQMFDDPTPGKAVNYTNVVYGEITCEGEPIALLKVTTHLTINANGDITAVVEKDTNNWICL